MASKILPIDDVIERTGLSRRTLYVEISENRFPRHPIYHPSRPGFRLRSGLHCEPHTGRKPAACQSKMLHTK